MIKKISLKILSLLAPLLLAQAFAADKPAAPAPAKKSGLLILQSETFQRKPDAEVGAMQAWDIEKGDVGAKYVRLQGTLPLHTHPDGDHRIYMLFGRMKLWLGDEEKELAAGDYAMIPKDIPHRAMSLGDAPAIFATVDIPSIDPKKIVWLEKSPPPGVEMPAKKH